MTDSVQKERISYFIFDNYLYWMFQVIQAITIYTGGCVSKDAVQVGKKGEHLQPKSHTPRCSTEGHRRSLLPVASNLLIHPHSVAGRTSVDWEAAEVPVLTHLL